jgi:hypothetical protein
MKRAQEQPRAGALSACAVTALALVLALIATTPAEAGPEQRRAYAGAAAAPPRPLAAPPATRGRGSLAVELSSERLLAGLPGQRLGVRFSLRGGVDPPRRIRVALRRVRRSDPRHPRRSVGGELIARRTIAVRGRELRLRLRGLNPQPGPLRLSLRGAEGGPEALLATARLAAVPQASAAAADPPMPRPQPRSAAPTARASGLVAGQVNHDLSFEDGSEASSAVAVQVDDPDRVIAATNDAGSAPQAFVSNRGLAAGSVGRRVMPTAARTAAGAQTTLTICCDPAVAADLSGNLWMAAATGAGAGPIALNRIAAGSTNFGGLTAALPTGPGAGVQEKPALAVLSDETVAAAWIETLGGVQNVVYSECEISAEVAACDDPAGWSAPVPVTATGGLYAMPSLALGPAGDAYVAWWDAGPDNAIEIDRCRDGESCAAGASWNEDSLIADLDSFDDDGAGGADPLPIRCPIIAAPGGLVNPSPSVEVGADDRVYVAYSDLRDNADPLAPTRCTASGSDSTFDSLAAAGGAPRALPAPNSGVRLSSDGALDLSDHFLPALSVDPSTGGVEATYYSTAADPGGQRAKRVHVSSGDSGQSYSAPTEISDAGSRFAGPLSDGIDYGDRQGVASAEGLLRAVWTDNRPQQGRDPDLYALSPPVETAIDSGPTGTVANAISSFGFSTAAPRIECRLDGSAFKQCVSPRTVGPLANGPHTFSARGTDLAGNPMDPAQPPTVGWTVLDQDPPETTIVRKPKRKTKSRHPKFRFVADEVEARFQCRYDGDDWRSCRSPKDEKVTVGRHSFRVRAIDVGGNVDPTAARHKFKRKRKCSSKQQRRGRC